MTATSEIVICTKIIASINIKVHNENFKHFCFEIIAL